MLWCFYLKPFVELHRARVETNPVSKVESLSSLESVWGVKCGLFASRWKILRYDGFLHLL